MYIIYRDIGTFLVAKISQWSVLADRASGMVSAVNDAHSSSPQVSYRKYFMFLSTCCLPYGREVRSAGSIMAYIHHIHRAIFCLRDNDARHHTSTAGSIEQ